MPVNTQAIQLKSATTVTLATDALTPTQNLTIVAAETGTADNLATINTSGFVSLTDSTNTFRPIVILMADAGDTITVKNGTGNITLNGGSDYALSGEKQLLLVYNGSKWSDVAPSSAGTGTVTSVGLSTNASYLTVGSTPVTTTGTITLNKTAALTANQVVATPDGVAGVADLRALVAADIPNLAASKITSGQLALAQGGTNADLSATGGTSQYLKQASVGAAVTVGIIADGDLPTTLAGKTLTTPTIASFANATHNHTNAAGGGQLTDAALSAAVSISKGGTGQTSQTAGFDALAPTTTKGDIIVYDGTDNIRVAVGTNNFVLTADSAQASGVKWAASGSATYNYARCTAIKTSGTGGDTFTASAWTTYPLTTEDVDAGNIVSISSNQFTLANAGTYRITGVYGFRTTSGAAMVSRLRCRNITDSSTDFQSTQITQNSALASTAGGSAITIQGVVTIAGSKTYAIQYYTSQAGSTGTALTSGDSEVYASLMIEQIA